MNKVTDMRKALDHDGQPAADTADSPKSGRFSVKRLIPILVLVLATVLFFVFDLHTYVSLDALKTHRTAVLDYYAAHQALTALLFGAAYTVVVALSIPGAIWMTLLAGFVFGTALGAAIVVVAATLGSLIVFLAARYAIGDLLYKKAGPFVRRMEEGFRKNAFSYLMFLRLVPVFPFWLVNLVPAFLNVGALAFAAEVRREQPAAHPHRHGHLHHRRRVGRPVRRCRGVTDGGPRRADRKGRNGR